MMFKKGSALQIENVWVPRNTKTASVSTASEELRIESEMPEDIVFSDDYVYSTVRAISARVNMNMDGFMKEELLGVIPDFIDIPNVDRNLKPHNDKLGYRTFIGKNNHVDHYNQPELASQDPKHEPRGKILWAWYEEDPLDQEVRLGPSVDPITKMAKNDCWVKLLMANDRRKFPVLCRAIEDGIVTKVSMGAEVMGSTCSVCGQFASAPWEYCNHVRFGRGEPFSAERGSHFVQAGIIRERDPVVAFENNHGLQFFEESWILDIQADPTAVIMDLIKAEPGTAMRHITASKTAGQRDYHQIMKDLINGETSMPDEDIVKIATILRKESANPNVNIEIDNIDEYVKQKREDAQNNGEETDEWGHSKEFDYNTIPAEQPGEFFPERPFPCSARQSAADANPEYPMDATIDVEVCQGCMYNASDKIGAVDCNFDDVVREGGSDPLPAGFETPGQGQNVNDSRASGIKNEDGAEVEEFPGIQHPPGFTDPSRTAKVAAFYRLKAMLDVGTGTWKTAEGDDVPRGDIERNELIKRDMGRPKYPNNKAPEEVDTFEHSIAISVPSTQVNKNPVDPEGRAWVIDSIRKVMSREFGGTRVQNEQGDFIEGNNLHTDDKVVIISGTDDYDRAATFIMDLAYALEDAFNQYAVEFFIDGKQYFTRDVHQE